MNMQSSGMAFFRQCLRATLRAVLTNLGWLPDTFTTVELEFTEYAKDQEVQR